MKKYSLILCVIVFAFGLNFSSCRSCKGGGWYGDRNLGYVPEQNPQEVKLPIFIELEEEACDITTP